MKARLVTLTLGLYLSLMVLACSKPAQQTSDTSTATPPPTATAPAETKPAREAEKPKPEPIVIPAGTTLTVRLGQAVGSKISQPGQGFSAALANPVEIGGRTAIPANANVTGTVVDAKPLGRFAGGASLQLQLNSIDIKGTDYPIQTSALTQTEKGKGKRTGAMVGGGAGLGAIVGALAGGGKGAAIGALSGVFLSAVQRGNQVQIPAEAQLDFTLQQAVTLPVPAQNGPAPRPQ